MNVALPVAVDSEPPTKVTGRVCEQRRRDFGQEFESALNEADGDTEKSLSETADASQEGSLPNESRSLAGPIGDESAKANPAASPAVGEALDDHAAADASKSWSAAPSMRLASILSSRLGDMPLSGQAISTAATTSAAAIGAAGEPKPEAAPDALPKTRIGVVAMATHFEPTAQDPRLVAGEARNVASPNTSLASVRTARQDTPMSATPQDSPASTTLQHASASAALREATAGPIGTLLAGAPEPRTGSDRYLTTGRDGRESERFAAKSETLRHAAPLAASAAAGNPAGEGGTSDRRSMENRIPSPREQAASPAVVTASDILVAGTPLQTPQIETPAALVSASGQIAERVATALAPLAHYPPSASQADSTLRYRAGGAALKSIQIQLQPENLGTVDVSMRLINGELAIELVTSEADTARILAEDNKTLKVLLEKAGFSLDEAAISILARDHAPARPGQASPIIQSDSQGGFGQTRQDGSSGEGNQERRSQAGGGPARQPVADAGESPPLHSRQGPSVYI